MAEYQIIVQFPSLTLVNMSAEQIVTAINASDEIIDADNVEGSTGGGGSNMTGNQIVNAINDEADDNHKIYAGHVRDLVKTMVGHGEKALNLIYTGDPRKTTFQNDFNDNILANDYILVAEVNQSEVFANGDWLIARTANPGFMFSDTSKWEIKKFANNSIAPVFRQHSGTQEIPSGGIESIPGECQAIGDNSFAVGYKTIAVAEGSQATGKESRASRIASRRHSTGKFTEPGDVQDGFDQMRLETTNAAPTEMALPFKFGFEANKTYVIKVQILSRVGVGGGYASGARAKEWEYKFLASQDSNGYVYHDGGLVSTTNLGNPNLGLSVTIVPEMGDISTPPLPTVFKGLKIQCTGLNGITVRWAAYLQVYELKL